MDQFPVRLSSKQKSHLDNAFARGKSSEIGKRAEEIVKIHFRNEHPNCQFSKPSDGTDLRVSWDNTEIRIEVKGTEDTKLAWSKLKVSSLKSYDQLRNGTPLYRVTGVFENQPVIYVLNYGADFALEPERRWTLKQIRS